MTSVLSLQRLDPEPVEPCSDSAVSCNSEESCNSWFSTLQAA